MPCRVARKCNQLAARPRPAACRISSRQRSSSWWRSSQAGVAPACRLRPAGGGTALSLPRTVCYPRRMDTVIFDIAERVATITLNRPDRLNAMNQQMRDELRACWQRVKDDPDIWVAIVTGAGRAFSSGADVEALATGGFVKPDRWRELAALLLKNAPLAVWGTKMAILQGLGLPIPQAEEIAAGYLEVVEQSEDHAEGPRAFVERREPRWKAR